LVKLSSTRKVEVLLPLKTGTVPGLAIVNISGSSNNAASLLLLLLVLLSICCAHAEINRIIPIDTNFGLLNKSLK
jgi:hypothetical protein